MKRKDCSYRDAKREERECYKRKDNCMKYGRGNEAQCRKRGRRS